MTSRINSVLNMRFILMQVTATKASVSFSKKHKPCYGGKVKKNLAAPLLVPRTGATARLGVTYRKFFTRFICVAFFAFC